MLELKDNHRITVPLGSELIQNIQPLKSADEVEVLDFLSTHPLLTFVMNGWIKDNGLVSQMNRGSFYGSRNQLGELDGVALVGHINLFETDSDNALSGCANLIKDCPSAFVLMGQRQRVRRLMDYYNPDSQPTQKVFRESLFEKRCKERIAEPVRRLRRATRAEVDLVVPVHAALTGRSGSESPRSRSSRVSGALRAPHSTRAGLDMR